MYVQASGSYKQLCGSMVDAPQLDSVCIILNGSATIDANTGKFIEILNSTSTQRYIGRDLELMVWLNRYTSLNEAAFKDVDKGHQIYELAIKRSLSEGTTFASYFATIHVNATEALIDILRNYGLRAFVGKVNMDQQSPSYYIETTGQSLKDAENFIKDVHDDLANRRLITPIITPRFAPSCTMDLVWELAGLARKYNLPIQTHFNESPSRIEAYKTYTKIYEATDLLTNRTILAHIVHVKESEIDLLAKYGVGVSH
ncbi:hypothetical protein EV182_003723, partial [Spiromyces aspiralis]